MTQPRANGINRQGLDAAFEAEEARKSTLMLEARLLRDREQWEGAAARFAEAAAIEERLSGITRNKGLIEKSVIHGFSAASCWAQAGNFYRAIELSDELLRHDELPDRLRLRIQEYADVLRARRVRWYEELVSTAAAAEA